MKWLFALLLVGCMEEEEATACTSLDYDSFAAPFFAQYCVSCHSSGLDDLRAVELEAVTLRTMPPSSSEAQPTSDERALLGEWLACGAP